MDDWSIWPLVILVIHVVVVTLVILRILLRPHREPASRVAWIVVVLSVPLLGVLAYILFGEVNIGRARIARLRETIEQLPAFPDSGEFPESSLLANVPQRYRHLFQVGRSINGFHVLGGNDPKLLADSNAAVDAMVSDIDAASNHVHVLFYIWLPDHNGLKVVEALKRAAGRGVTCRAMADSLGSRLMIRSPHWQEMGQAGVRLAEALPIGNPILKALRGRVDLRNHRKLVVVDGRITYSGSQNCADPEFRIKAKFGPWVDIMVRLEGPVAAQNQRLFAADWMSQVDENLHDLLVRPVVTVKNGISAQAFGTGPTVRYSAMPEMFETLIHAARRKLVITTPYYVPDDAMQGALCAAGNRGVDATIVFPARNDSWIVSAASRSYYPDLLAAGVRIREFADGLLHAKTLTLDDEVALIGSANMDRRSFDLNYENNILLYDPDFTAQICQRQEDYIRCSRVVSAEGVAGWPVRRRLWNNTIAMLGPLL
jgi:cardiolipin synthase